MSGYEAIGSFPSVEECHGDRGRIQCSVRYIRTVVTDIRFGRVNRRTVRLGRHARAMIRAFDDLGV